MRGPEGAIFHRKETSTQSLPYKEISKSTSPDLRSIQSTTEMEYHQLNRSNCLPLNTNCSFSFTTTLWPAIENPTSLPWKRRETSKHTNIDKGARRNATSTHATEILNSRPPIPFLWNTPFNSIEVTSQHPFLYTQWNPYQSTTTDNIHNRGTNNLQSCNINESYQSQIFLYST